MSMLASRCCVWTMFQRARHQAGQSCAFAHPIYFESLDMQSSGETTFADVMEALDAREQHLADRQAKHDDEVAEIKSNVRELAAKAGRPQFGGNEPSSAGKKVDEVWLDTKTQKPVNVLTHGQSLSDHAQAPAVGRFLRGIVMGGRAGDADKLSEERKAMVIGDNVAGGFTVAGTLANEWIDLLRAEMVLSQAGARTVPMPSGTLSLARVTGDPAISWHGENAALSDAAPTLGQITLTARTVVCLVKMSLELSQDSANIEQILTSTIVKAMAGAIDSAGLVGVTGEGSGVAPSGVTSLSGRNTVTSIGAPTSWDFAIDGLYELMADNVALGNVGAMVAHPALWKKMAKLKSGIASDNTPLTAPDEVAKLRKLWTTAAPLTGGNTATAIVADWRDLLFGVRTDITVRVLQEAYLGTNLQVAVLAYARVDFGATRHKSFCTLEGITVA